MMERAIRFWWFDWRHNRQWILLFIMFFCLFSLCLLRAVSSSLKETTLRDTNKIVGADWVLESSLPPDVSWKRMADRSGILSTETLETSSVILKGEQSVWVAVKAVGENYPLLEPLITQAGPSALKEETRFGPAPGEVWIAPKVYHQLNLSIGDWIDVGYLSLEVTGLILEEPDRSGRFYDLAPRVMMNRADLAATRLIQTHSRAEYRILFLEHEENWSSFESWLRSQLRVHDKLKSGVNLRPALKSSLDRAKTYYDLVGLMALLLSGSALMMCLDRYLRRQQEKVALLKTMGLSVAGVSFIYCVHWLCMSVIAIVLVLLLTTVMLYGFSYSLESLFSIELVQPSLSHMLASLMLVMLWLWVIGVVRFYHLMQASPIEILTDRKPSIENKNYSLWIGASVVFSLALWGVTFGLSFGFVLLGVLAWSSVLVAVCFFVAQSIKSHLHRISFRFRLVLRQWFYKPKLFFLQVVALSFVLLSCASVYQFKNDLFSAWESEIPPDAPNFFLINIFKENIGPLKALIEGLGFSYSDPYPIVRGRLIKINGEGVVEKADDTKPGRRIDRELNLTWSNDLPFQNKILAGTWLDASNILNQVSIEEGVAERLGVALGDELTFSIALREVSAKITSIRQVRWDSMTPNFYMIFPSGLLDDEVFTYMTSLYIPEEMSLKTIEVNRAFPEINVLDIQVFINQIRNIKDYVSIALTFANMVLMVAVIGVIAAAMTTTWDERLIMYSIGQLIGMRSSFVLVTLVYEYALLGFLCGLIASFASQALAYWGYTHLLDLSWSFNWAVVIGVPVISALALAVMAGVSVCVLLRSSALDRTRSLIGR